VIVAALIARFLPLDDAERSALDALVHPSLRNWNGVTVGQVRPTAALM
jgi:L-asparaginase II